MPLDCSLRKQNYPTLIELKFAQSFEGEYHLKKSVQIDYYLQASAYFIAWWSMTGRKANGAEIWIANEDDNLPQKFTLTQSDLEFYAKEFIKRRNMFKEKHNI